VDGVKWDSLLTKVGDTGTGKEKVEDKALLKKNMEK